jgi:hypothetical protein
MSNRYFDSNKELAQAIIVIIGLISTIVVFMIPLYLTFTDSPWCFLLFTVSWIPAILTGLIFTGLIELIDQIW